jgi:hypothetical protein
MIGDMKRATITFPDDLAEALDDYIRTQEVAPALTTIMQTALREYLRERGFLRPYKPLKITPAGRGSGRSDVSLNHDRYFAGLED